MRFFSDEFYLFFTSRQSGELRKWGSTQGNRIWGFVSYPQSPRASAPSALTGGIIPAISVFPRPPMGASAALCSQMRLPWGSTVPGIALSGYGQEEDLRRTKEVGFVVHLIKPISPARLASAIAGATSVHPPVQS